MSLFTPSSGLLGGSLIGLSASTLLLCNGDILGASGIVSSLFLSPKKTLTDPSERWKIALLASFLLTGKIYINFFDKDVLSDGQVGFNPNLPIVSSLGHAVAGFLVGFGTKLGNGCTTGHGICGLARFSKRSLVAVCTFMATGFISATMCNPDCPLAQFLRSDAEHFRDVLPTRFTESIGSALVALFTSTIIAKMVMRKSGDESPGGNCKIIPAAVSGSIFSLGLAISGMTLSSKIYGFLDLTGFSRGTYDPTLMMVMGGGLIVSCISYQFVRGFNVIKHESLLSCPLIFKDSSSQFNVPASKVIDLKLLLGEAMFGLGWGIGGICPGPGIFLAGAGFPCVLFQWWPSFALGSYLAQKVIAGQNRKK